MCLTEERLIAAKEVCDYVRALPHFTSLETVILSKRDYLTFCMLLDEKTS